MVFICKEVYNLSFISSLLLKNILLYFYRLIRSVFPYFRRLNKSLIWPSLMLIKKNVTLQQYVIHFIHFNFIWEFKKPLWLFKTRQDSVTSKLRGLI